VLEVPDAFSGREVRCPECQATFVAGPSTDFTAKPGSPAGSAAIQAGSPAAWRSTRPGDAEDDELDYRAIGARPFRPAGGLTIAAKVLLALNLLMSVVLLGSEFLQYRLATRLVQGEEVPFVELDSNDARQMILGLLHFAIYLATIVVFLMWFYRVHSNLEPLGARGLSYSSGYAVGCWFIPFLNLVRPAQVAQEIWRNSDPNAVSDGISREGPSSALIGLWWIVWIISNIIANISVRMAWSVNSPETLLTATAAGMIAEVASIIAALLALSVVFAIDARQSARASALQAALGFPHDSEIAQ
jgi:hypothetical protein